MGGTWTLGVSLLLITLAALAALRVRRNARQQEADLAGSGNTPTAGLFEGFRVLVRNRLLLGTTVLIAAGNIGLAIGDSVEAILVLRVLDLGVLFYGALGTIAACAGLLASVVAPRIVQTIP
ncbi:hypothetical protein ACFOEP_12685 [Microbacterium amylolyticum]|uniref:hypothetical protein n=1 Tax=Microbacterium amylolyticum TaxID=936337 RepID=UPI00361D4689